MSTEGPGASLAADAARRALTVGLVMMITVAAFEALATATIMPAVKDDLGGVALYSWAFSAFLLASLVGITFAGEQADRLGPGRPYAIGLALFATGLLIAGLAPSMWVLVVGRAIQGLGGGVIPPIAYVAVGRAYPEEARPRMFALFATAWVVPGLIGPGLAGVTAEYLTWRLVFMAILPLVGAAALLTLPALRRIGPPANAVATPMSRTRLRGALLVALGAGATLSGLSAASPWLSPPLIIAGLALGVPPLVKLMPPGTFRARRGLPSIVLGIGLLNLAFFGTDAFVPFMLTEVRDQNTVFVGAIFTASTLFWTAGTWSVERLKDRVSRVTFVAAGLALVGLATLGHIAVLSESVPVIFSAVTWSIGAFGIGIAYPSFSLLLLSEATPGNEGTVSSGAKLAEALSAALGAGIVGAIVAAGDSSGRLSESLAVAFLLMAVAALAATALARRVRTGATGDTAMAPVRAAAEATVR